MRALLAGLAGLLLATSATAQTRYAGLCDASAGVALDAQHYIVADDEHNTLSIYRQGVPAPVGRVELAAFLKTEKESDLEGAAQIGSRIYWISSHARNSKGKVREDRWRFFATGILAGGPSGAPQVQPVGLPYTLLLRDLLAAPTLAGIPLKAGSELAAEADGGLNIEGLAAGPDGSLLIGLRNPIPAGKALLIPLLNPAELVGGKGPARFGEALRLALGGRGIRSVERVGSGYLIVAGPVADTGTFALFRWSGKPADAPAPLKVNLGSLRPEGLFAWPDGQLTIVSDDGGVLVGGKPCKEAAADQRRFRAAPIAKP